MLRLSVLDSSYNPPTLAHLALLRANDTDADAHLLVFSPLNAQKAAAHDVLEDRVALMRALADHVVASSSSSSSSSTAASSNDSSAGVRQVPNIAVAVLARPTFVEKAQVLAQALPERISHLLSSDGASLSPVRTQQTCRADGEPCR